MLVGELMATLTLNDAAFLSGIARAKSSFSGLGSYATSQGNAVGSNFARGIASGISANTGVIQAAARAAAASAAAAARAALQIQSPSRVGASIGQFFGAGIAGGITAMQKNVSDAAYRLAKSAADAPFDAPNLVVNQRIMTAAQPVAATASAPAAPSAVLVLDGKEVARTLSEDTNQALGGRARQLAIGYGG